MVIFLYISRLSLNNKLFIPKIRIIVLLYITVSMALPKAQVFQSENIYFSLVYSNFQVSIVFFLVIYLLVILIFTRKLSESFKGALVQKF